MGEHAERTGFVRGLLSSSWRGGEPGAADHQPWGGSESDEPFANGPSTGRNLTPVDDDGDRGAAAADGPNVPLVLAVLIGFLPLLVVWITFVLERSTWGAVLSVRPPCKFPVSNATTPFSTVTTASVESGRGGLRLHAHSRLCALARPTCSRAGRAETAAVPLADAARRWSRARHRQLSRRGGPVRTVRVHWR